MESPGSQPPSGGEEINQVAQEAFDEAQANGAEPQEAFDAAAGAIREAGAEAGVPSEVVEEGIGAASEAFQQSMNEGGDPAAAFDSAMEAGESAANDMPPPGGEMAGGDMPPPGGEMAGGDMPPPGGEMAEGDMPAPDGGIGNMLDAAMSSDGTEPLPGENTEPTGADLALEQAVSESEADQAQQEPADAFADQDMPEGGLAEGDIQPEEEVDQPVESA
jgi:hypothetical protein